MTQASQSRSFIDVLEDVAAGPPEERLSIGDLCHGLKDRAFGLLMLVLALPPAIPFLPPPLPSFFGIPMFLVAMQMFLGRSDIWLPKKTAQRSFKRQQYQTLVAKGKPWIQRLLFLMKPRLQFMTHGWRERFVGLAMAIFAISVCVPLPGTNTIPSIAILIISVGLLQRDGLCVLLGVLSGIFAVILIAIFGEALITALYDFYQTHRL